MSWTLRGALALGALLGACWTSSGCLRLDGPDAFTCSSNADCPSGEKCSELDNICVSSAHCDGDDECGSDLQVCRSNRCLPVACTYRNESACGGFKCDFDACATWCFGSGHQDDYACAAGYLCEGSSCVVASGLDDGRRCSEPSNCTSGECCERPGATPGFKLCSSDCAGQMPAPVPCTAAQPCASGHCCSLGGGQFRACQADPCVPAAVGAACSLPEDCASGSCVQGVCSEAGCLDDAACSAGYCDGGGCSLELLSPGEACQTDKWCFDDACVDGVCRGEGVEQDECSADSDCEAGRGCCTVPYDTSVKRCGPATGSCDGTIGGACQADDDCLNMTCVETTVCTESCITDSDCGNNPLGLKNYCMISAAGPRMCFSGCAQQADCTELADFFECVTAPSVTGASGKVCTGSGIVVPDLRINGY